MRKRTTRARMRLSAKIVPLIAAGTVVTFIAASGTASAAQSGAKRLLAPTTAQGPVDRAYVVAQSGGIASFNLYPDGSIRSLAPVLPTGAGTFGIATSPNQHYLYVEPGLGLGTQYSLIQKPELITVRILNDGGLSTVGTPIALDPALTPVTGVISHNGRNLYLGVGNTVAGFENGAVIHYRIGHGGVPVQQGAPVSMGLPTDGAAEPIISPDGKWLYVASYVASAIVTFAIHPDGSLSSQPVGRMDVGYGPITPIISPNGRFLYITNELNQTIRGFAIEPNGSLKPVPGSPFASGSIPHNFVFSADGKYLYSANTAGSDISGLTTGGGSISAFAVQQDGALVPLPGSPYRSLPGPITVNMSTSGQWLYVTSSPQSGADRAVELSSYKINADGTLDMSQAHSVATGQQAADGPETVVIPAQH